MRNPPPGPPGRAPGPPPGPPRKPPPPGPPGPPGRPGRSAPGRPGRWLGICDGFGRGPPIEAGLGRGGIDAGLGRGMPAGEGRGAPPAARGAPPWMPNGLLPPGRGGRLAGVGPAGRGPAGARPSPPSGRPGVGPGRGAVGRGAWGRSRCCWAARTAASCSAFNAAARCSAAATSMSWALVGRSPGGGPGTGPRRGAPRPVSPGFGVVRGGAGRAVLAAPLPDGAAAGAAGAAAAPAASMLARSRRATGGSMVLDADLTYSPISCSLASTILLSTPSSLASSCTRGLPATTLLIPRSSGRRPRRPHYGT